MPEEQADRPVNAGAETNAGAGWLDVDPDEETSVVCHSEGEEDDCLTEQVRRNGPGFVAAWVQTRASAWGALALHCDWGCNCRQGAAANLSGQDLEGTSLFQGAEASRCDSADPSMMICGRI